MKLLVGLLTARTGSIDSEVIGVGSVLTAEVEVERGGREVRLRVDVDGARALEVALGMAVDMFLCTSYNRPVRVVRCLYGLVQ